VTLKCRLVVSQGQWKWLGTVFYLGLPSIVTMALSCIISVIKLDINRNFFIPLAFDAPVRGCPRQSIAIPFSTVKLEWWGYRIVEKV